MDRDLLFVILFLNAGFMSNRCSFYVQSVPSFHFSLKGDFNLSQKLAELSFRKRFSGFVHVMATHGHSKTIYGFLFRHLSFGFLTTVSSILKGFTAFTE
jgi:hypothetical protein